MNVVSVTLRVDSANRVCFYTPLYSQQCAARKKKKKRKKENTILNTIYTYTNITCDLPLWTQNVYRQLFQRNSCCYYRPKFLLRPLAHEKRNWNKTMKQLWNVLDLFQSCFRPRLRWLFQRFVSHARGTETKQVKQRRRWSAEIKQICFSFVSVLFQFHFTCASSLSNHNNDVTLF